MPTQIVTATAMPTHEESFPCKVWSAVDGELVNELTSDLQLAGEEGPDASVPTGVTALAASGSLLFTGNRAGQVVARDFRDCVHGVRVEADEGSRLLPCSLLAQDKDNTSSSSDEDESSVPGDEAWWGANAHHHHQGTHTPHTVGGDGSSSSAAGLRRPHLPQQQSKFWRRGTTPPTPWATLS